MRKYFIRRGEFGNDYDLRYTEDMEQEQQAEEEGYERITQKEAFALAKSERERRKYDHAFSGYADAAIYPLGYDGQYYQYIVKGYIAERA